MHIRRFASVCFAAAALSAFSFSSQAAPFRIHVAAEDMTVIDGGAGYQTNNLSGDAIGKLLVNYADGEVTSKGATAVLVSLPDALLSADPADLDGATLTFHVARARNWDGEVFTPRLFPLATPYVLSEATWTNASSGTAWTTAGGDTLATSVAGVYSTNDATLSFELLPLLRDAAAFRALAANGALVRLGWDELPDVAGFTMLQLHTTRAEAALVPDVDIALATGSIGLHAAAADMTVIDGGAGYQTNNLSGDAIGKLLVNYADGEVTAKGATAVLLSLPDALLSADSVALAGASLTIHVAGAKNWDADTFTPCLFPLTTPYELSEATWIDASAGTAWTTPGGDMLDASVAGVYSAADATLTFDLLPLLSDASARDALAANGALIRLACDELPDNAGFTMLRLYTTKAEDALLPEVAVALSTGSLRVHAAAADMTVIDGGAGYQTNNLSGDSIGKLLVNYADGEVTAKGATAVLLSLPDALLDADPDALAAATLSIQVAGARNWDADTFTPCLFPLTTPYELSEATWIDASAGTAWTTAGGDTLDASVAGVYSAGDATLTFDLLPLLSDASARDALAANGALIRLACDELPDNAGFTMLRLHTTKAEAAFIPYVSFLLLELQDVTFDANGGTCATTNQLYMKRNAYGELPAAAWTGYAFDGWWTAAEGGEQVTAESLVTQENDRTLWAHWTTNTYAVVLDAGEGTGGTASVTATFGEALPAIETPEREGWTFAGYFSGADGTGTQYYSAAGEGMAPWTTAAGGTLYAKWAPESAPLTVWRFYSKTYKGHFFTISEEEKETLIATNPNWKFEGGAYRAYTEEAAGTTALHRFYSKNYRGHFFTIDEAEKDTIIASNRNWNYEGVAYYVYPEETAGTVAVFRFWSKKYRHHFYTIDEAEKADLEAHNPNWKYEGVAFYALALEEAAEGAAKGAGASGVESPAGLESQEEGKSGGEKVRAHRPGSGRFGGGVLVTTSDGTDGSAVADGDEGTGWSPEGAGAGWVVLSLEEPVEVAGLEVTGEGLPADWRALLSEDAEEWGEEMPCRARYVWVSWPEGAPVVREVHVVIP